MKIMGFILLFSMGAFLMWSLRANNTKEQTKIKIEKTDYHGWKDSYKLSNDKVEVVIVPAIGRIMYFGFKGGENILWNNPEFFGITLPAGKLLTKNGEIIWANFGGDKVWPKQEDDWLDLNGYSWPPDHWFDGGSHTAAILQNAVRITSPVSDYCGARSIREIIIKESGAEIIINQKIEKVKQAQNQSAELDKYTIWNITQIRMPLMALFNLNPNSSLPDRYILMKPNTVDNFSVEGDIGVLIPDKSKKLKAGADSDHWLAAIVDDVIIGEFFRLQPDASYPDNGLSVEVYTEPAYTEVELLSPLKHLAVGETMHFTITWRLHSLPKKLSSIIDKKKEAVEWLNSYVK